jgi:hypothetical protein
MIQTQHAIASQNWQRIEGSLQVRAESLEKEKNDLTKRLEEEKRKVKDAVLALRPPMPLIVEWILMVD